MQLALLALFKQAEWLGAFNEQAGEKQWFALPALALEVVRLPMDCDAVGWTVKQQLRQLPARLREPEASAQANSFSRG